MPLADASPAEIGTVVTALIALCTLATLGLTLFRREPALHKQFADKVDTDKKLDRLEEKQEEILGELKSHNTAQYDARRRMHKVINSHSNALNYLAGQLDAKGDPNGKRIRDILRQNPEGEEGE